jgi:Viral BACON domain
VFWTVNPGAIIDTIALGSTTPVVASVQVINGGNGSLSWRARVLRAMPWLSIQPDSGIGGQSFSVRIDPSGLGVGDYRDTVVVSVPATGQGSNDVPVTIRIQ